MPTYEYKCQSCGKVEERFHSMTEELSLSCDKCKNSMEKIISFNAHGFVFKGGTTTIHQREKEHRKKKALTMSSRMAKRYGKVSPNIKPNIAGVETGSWHDAQKMAKEAGLNHETFTPWVEKEKKEKKGLIVP